MGQPITQAFITTADDSGAKKISSALKNVNKDLTETQVISEATGKTMDILGGRSERLAARFVFRDLALQATGAASAVKTTASASEAAFVGLELLGRAALGFSGTLGLVILGVATFIEIIAKLRGKSAETAETVKENSQKMLQQAEAAKTASKSLLQLNAISAEQAAQLKDISKLHDDELKKLEADISAKEKLATQEVKLLTAQQSSNVEGGKGLSLRVDLAKALEKQKRLQEELIALGVVAETQVKDETKDLDAQVKLNQLLIEQGVQRDVKTHNRIDLQNALTTAQEEVTASETNYIAALKSGDKDFIESAQKRMEAAKAMFSTIKTGNQSLEADEKKTADIIKKGATDIGNAWEVQNKKLIFSTEKAASAIISTVANQIETELAMAAARDFASGDIVKGAAEAAAVGVVASLAGIASAELGAGASASGASASPAGSATAAAPSVGGGTGSTDTGKQTAVQVNIYGGMVGHLDPAFLSNLSSKISQAVQGGGATLVSSSVFTGTNPVGV